MAVVPVRRPVTTEHQHVWIDWTTIEVSDFNRMRGVGEIHDGDAALIPALHCDVAAGDRNQRTVMGHTVFTEPLRRGQLVVAREFQFVVLEVEDGVSAPLVRIGSAAACTESAAP